MFAEVSRAWALRALGRDQVGLSRRSDLRMLAAVPYEVEGIGLMQARRCDAADRSVAPRRWSGYHRRGELRSLWAQAESARAWRQAGRGRPAARRRVAAGGSRHAAASRLHPALAAGCRVHRSAPRQSGGGAQPLSARQREVLGLVARGLTNDEIAARLGTSRHTVIAQINAASPQAGRDQSCPTPQPSPRQAPSRHDVTRFVVIEPTAGDAEPDDAALEAVAAQVAPGSVVVHGWGLGRNAGQARVVRVGWVRSAQDAESAVTEAVAGALLVVSATADRDVIDPLCDDLRRLGDVDHRVGQTDRPALTDDERLLLAAAARRRDARRGCPTVAPVPPDRGPPPRGARQVLGASTTAAALHAAVRLGIRPATRP